ncbi:MAG: MFS transporter [Tumebacillaceae bacterium]
MDMARMSSFFGNRFVQAIMLSGLFLQIGIWVRNFSVLLFIMEKTNNDPTAVSLISAAEFVPIFLFSFIGGTFADRWRPKRTMVLCDFFSAISVFVVLLTLLSGTWQAVFFATLVSAILSQFSQPSAMKLFKQHVPEDQLQMGMAMFQTLMASFMIVGPALGTFVFQTFGINTAIAVMGVAFLLSAGVLTFLPADRPVEVKSNPSLFGEMREGVRYVMSKPVLKVLGGAFMAAGLGVGIIQPLGVFIIVEKLGLPKENLQWMMMANGLAMLIGGGAAMGLSKKIAPQKLLAAGMFVAGVGTGVFAMSSQFWLTMVIQFVIGLFLPLINIGINTLMLQSTEEEFIGRANGILNPLFMGMMVITMSIAGWMKQQLSLVSCYELAAGLFLIGVIVILPLFKMKLNVKKEQETKAVPSLEN